MLIEPLSVFTDKGFLYRLKTIWSKSEEMGEGYVFYW